MSTAFVTLTGLSSFGGSLAPGQVIPSTTICVIGIDESGTVTISPDSINPDFLDVDNNISIPQGTKLGFTAGAGGEEAIPLYINLTLIASQLGGEQYSEATITGISGYWYVVDSERGFGMMEGSRIRYTSTLLGYLDDFDTTLTSTFAGLYATEPVPSEHAQGFKVKNLTSKNRTLMLLPAEVAGVMTANILDPSSLPKNVKYHNGAVLISLTKGA